MAQDPHACSQRLVWHLWTIYNHHHRIFPQWHSAIHLSSLQSLSFVCRNMLAVVPFGYVKCHRRICTRAFFVVVCCLFCNRMNLAGARIWRLRLRATDRGSWASSSSRRPFTRAQVGASTHLMHPRVFAVHVHSGDSCLCRRKSPSFVSDWES